jgi:glycerophosphoryl diester phosphodiesterase
VARRAPSPSLVKVQIIAHRGASGVAPENTLSSFRAAWDQGADGIELDLHLSRDGTPVVFHDRTLRRITGSRGNVEDLTFSELRQLDAGAWKNETWRGEKIPSLEEVLESLPENKSAWLELKTDGRILEPLRKVLENHSARLPNLRLIAFSEELINLARKQFPEISCSWIVDLGSTSSRKRGMVLRSAIETAIRSRLDGLDFGLKTSLTAEQVKAVKSEGLGLCVWTIDRSELACSLAEAGVDAITTNWPAKIRTSIQSIG